ncbi:MAG: glycosyltransferase family 4 protein [Ilumatobacteraceae bacterium]
MKLLYIITEDWFFTSHFLERAVVAKLHGFDVAVATRSKSDASRIEAHGIRVIPVEFSRHGLNPIRELATVRQLRRAIKAFDPNIVHNIALKPVVLGTLAARTCRIQHIVNAPVGMGYIFSSHDRKARILRPFIRQIFRLLLNPRGSRVIIENQDDFESLISSHFVRKDDLILIKGAGVDTDVFVPTPEPAGPIVISLISRMLRDKGVVEFVNAARFVAKTGVDVRFQLIGDIDSGNPTTLKQSQLEEWNREGIVSWKGHVSDIPTVLSGSHIVCLPSYREGLPKSLIEALAAGRPVVTTNVPGCREVVIDEDNGLLVEPRDPRALADALQRLIADKELRIKFGAAGRLRAEHEFSATRINSQTLAVYESLAKP